MLRHSPGPVQQPKPRCLPQQRRWQRWPRVATKTNHNSNVVVRHQSRIRDCSVGIHDTGRSNWTAIWGINVAVEHANALDPRAPPPTTSGISPPCDANTAAASFRNLRNDLMLRRGCRSVPAFGVRSDALHGGYGRLARPVALCARACWMRRDCGTAPGAACGRAPGTRLRADGACRRAGCQLRAVHGAPLRVDYVHGGEAAPDVAARRRSISWRSCARPLPRAPGWQRSSLTTSL